MIKPTPFLPGLDRPLAIVDIETTGGSVTRDRITEIGIVEVDENGVREWSTLINPQMAIPYTIQRLTGITDAMVAEAPRFEQVAKDIFLRLQGKVFVAHNVRFDYGFLRNAFGDLGFALNQELLCTVRLSRALYPAAEGHSLEKIIQRFNIPVDSRHRAMADARATWAFICRARDEKPPQEFAQAIQNQTRRPSLPPGLDAAVLDDLPNAPGVYYFYGEGGALLYVGKSVDLRKRVLSHFCADHATSREMKLCQQVRDIRVTQTTGELSALLLEAQEIKTLQPLFNRRLRRVSQLHTIQLREDKLGLLRPETCTVNQADRSQRLYGLFRGAVKARETLAAISRERGLCDHILVRPSPLGSACMSRQLKRCKGLCSGDWSALHHNTALMDALGTMALKTWPYTGPVALLERAKKGEDYTAFIIDNWCLVATDAGVGEPAPAKLQEFRSQQAFLDKDIYRYLVKALLKPGPELRVVPLKAG